VTEGNYHHVAVYVGITVQNDETAFAPDKHKVVTIPFRRIPGNSTENASRSLL